jgi:RecB family exonuclease
LTEFRLPLGSSSAIGCIDRVNRVNDETIEVVDYKTNRAIFTREEVDDSLQLSLYEVRAPHGPRRCGSRSRCCGTGSG